MSIYKSMPVMRLGLDVKKKSKKAIESISRPARQKQGERQAEIVARRQMAQSERERKQLEKEAKQQYIAVELRR